MGGFGIVIEGWCSVEVFKGGVCLYEDCDTSLAAADMWLWRGVERLFTWRGDLKIYPHGREAHEGSEDRMDLTPYLRLHKVGQYHMRCQDIVFSVPVFNSRAFLWCLPLWHMIFTSEKMSLVL